MKLIHKKIIQSPFILATIAGGVAVVFDLLWLLSEILLTLHLNTEEGHLIARCIVGVGLTGSFILAVIAIVQYIRNGYVRNDTQIEACEILRKHQQNKRNKIFK